MTKKGCSLSLTFEVLFRYMWMSFICIIQIHLVYIYKSYLSHPLALLLSAYKYTLVCSGLGQVDLLAHCPVQCYCPIFYFKLVLALKITTINVNISCFHSVYQLIDDLDSDKTLEDMGHTLNTFVTQS